MVLLFTQLVDSVKPGKVNTILIDNSAAPMLNFALAIWTKFYKSLSANQKKTNPTFCWCFCLCKSFFMKFTIAPSTSISFCLKTEIFLCGLAYRRHVFRRNSHRKRIFSKRLSRVKFSENAGFSVYVRTDKNGCFRIQWYHASFTTSTTHAP